MAILKRVTSVESGYTKIEITVCTIAWYMYKSFARFVAKKAS